MKTPILVMTLATFCAAGAAKAQSSERVDPQTGNYKPVPDSFEADMPNSDGPNPNRLNNRISPRSTTGANGRSSSQVQSSTKQADRVAGSNAADAPSIAFVPSTFQSMGDMVIYTPPSGAATVADDPFAKPDWWPQ
jgi:hypothetical protein